MKAATGAVLVVLCAGCIDLSSSSSSGGWLFGSPKKQQPVKPRREALWLLAAGGGCILTFDPDMEAAGGGVLHFGVGRFSGGGVRYMDFDYRDRSNGDRYSARTLMGYAGASGGECAGTGAGWGYHCGLGLGGTRITGSGADGTGFAGGVVLGVYRYHDLPSVACGLTAEVGLFFAAPDGIPLHGLSLLFGGYLYF
jgi:hypothetical protein